MAQYACLQRSKVGWNFVMLLDVLFHDINDGRLMIIQTMYNEQQPTVIIIAIATCVLTSHDKKIRSNHDNILGPYIRFCISILPLGFVILNSEPPI